MSSGEKMYDALMKGVVKSITFNWEPEWSDFAKPLYEAFVEDAMEDDGDAQIGPMGREVKGTKRRGSSGSKAADALAVHVDSPQVEAPKKRSKKTPEEVADGDVAGGVAAEAAKAPELDYPTYDSDSTSDLE